jgi:hypothetical protein
VFGCSHLFLWQFLKFSTIFDHGNFAHKSILPAKKHYFPPKFEHPVQVPVQGPIPVQGPGSPIRYRLWNN